MSVHPYQGLDPSAYWRSGVAEKGPYGLQGLWSPKFEIQPSDTIATAGSCFAQHIGLALSQRGYGWRDFEPAPPYLSGAAARRFNYGVFSFRTGNIYTPSMLLQWLQLAYGQLPEPYEVWHENGRCYDPLRPTIEPDGFSDEAELFAARAATYAAIRNAVENTDLFVFTLGLTESWRNAETGLEYALCPGTVVGTFDERLHSFTNANTRGTTRNLGAALNLMRRQNPKIKILLTVSPVPLTATASGQHVLTASTYSKSVLRAVAGMVSEEIRDVDYFPSYEIITNPVFRGMFYAPNMRSVEPEGVRNVMDHFFADQARVFGAPPARRAPVAQDVAWGGAMDADVLTAEENVKCEEELLDAFAV